MGRLSWIIRAGPVDPKGPCERKVRKSGAEKEMYGCKQRSVRMRRCYTTGLEDRKGGQEPRKAGGLQSLEEAEKQSPLRA